MLAKPSRWSSSSRRLAAKKFGINPAGATKAKEPGKQQRQCDKDSTRDARSASRCFVVNP